LIGSIIIEIRKFQVLAPHRLA